MLNISVWVAFLIMFIPVLVVYGVVEIFSEKGWTSVYTALDDESYFRVVGKLKQAGIRYKTKSSFNLTTTPFGGNRQRHYEIFVKEEDANNAYYALHS